MCGIAGIIALSPHGRVRPAELTAMAGAIAHRGPDDQRFHLSHQADCGLAFRRLSIIDLECGQQPISNEDESVWLVFNGEIYNFRELRAELVPRHQFRTNADSEVIAHLYEEVGEKCFERLDGMFAIALWDQKKRELLLARDRFGKKPLVCATANERLFFASELKSILAVGLEPRIDPQSLHRYLTFQYVPAPHCIYRDFFKITPGHYLKLQAGKPSPLACQRYWRLPRPDRFAGSYNDAQVELQRRLTAAVQKRLIADVPVGAFLSGGIDSSIVVGLMGKLGASPLRTFSISFADPRYDESRYARIVAKHFQTEHHEQRVTPAAAEIIPRLATHFDEPFADSSAIPTWYVSQHARQSVTVALTGDGGDECFMGYERYQAARIAQFGNVVPRAMRSFAAWIASRFLRDRPKSFSNRLRRLLLAAPGPPSEQYMSWMTVFNSEQLRAGYNADFRQRIEFDEPTLWFDSLHPSAPGDAPERANRVDFQSYLPYDLLTKVDIASMAHGLECRCPFLDPAVVELALSLPREWKMTLRKSKRILKDWAQSLLPADILTRPKMGFGVPIGDWFRGELRPMLMDELLSRDSLACVIFDRRWLGQLLDEHLQERANYEHPLWALLMLEAWRKRWDARL